MKNIYFTILFSLTTLIVSADEFEKNYGKGVVHIQFDSIYQLHFFSSPQATTPSHNIFIMRDAWSLGTHYVSFDSIHFVDSVPRWFTTVFYLPRAENARIDIIATDSVNGFYRTILKDDQGRDVWLKKSKYCTFLTWFGFYNTVSSIEPSEGDVILYDKPDPKSKRINYTPMMEPGEPSSMRALEVNGQWMKVELRFPQHDPMLSWKTYTGWIKWRDDKQPLVKYNLMGC